MINVDKGRVEFRGTEEDLILEFCELVVCLAKQRKLSVDFITKMVAASLAFSMQKESDNYVEVIKDEIIKHHDEEDDDVLKKMFGDLFNE